MVIVVEQIYKGRQENPEKSSSTIVADSLKQLLPAMIASSLSTLIIFVPYVLMSGAAGAYFKVLAFTIIVSLGSSFLVSWLLTPALYLLLLRQGLQFKQSNRSVSSGWINWILRNPIVGCGIVVFCMASLAWIPGKLATGFLPDMDETTLLMNYSKLI